MLDVTLTLRQPLALGMRPSVSAPVRTHRHVPGSVLRGALAAAWIRDYGTPDKASAALKQEFLALFERGVRYSPLLDSKSEIEPISVWLCKYRPTKDCHAFRYDEALPVGSAPKDWECPCCGHALERSRGKVIFREEGGVERQSVRVALGEDETAKDGSLFTRRALTHLDAEGNERVLRGSIIGGTDWLLTRREILLGGRRSTSGAAAYKAERGDGAAVPVVDQTLVLRLDSPAILIDAAGRPTDRLDECLLRRILGVGVTHDRQWIRRERVGGWHAASNLPKPDELAVSAGSVYRLDLDAKPDTARVRKLLDHGVGLRRAEGFGWIHVAQPQRPVSRPEEPSPPSATVRSAVDVIVDRLRGSGFERWIGDKLRDYREHLDRGGKRNSSMLTLPQAEGLTRSQRQALELLLLNGDQARITAVIKRLDAIASGDTQ